MTSVNNSLKLSRPWAGVCQVHKLTSIELEGLGSWIIETLSLRTFLELSSWAPTSRNWLCVEQQTEHEEGGARHQEPDTPGPHDPGHPGWLCHCAVIIRIVVRTSRYMFWLGWDQLKLLHSRGCRRLGSGPPHWAQPRPANTIKRRGQPWNYHRCGWV